jgi:hypothetical protein
LIKKVSISLLFLLLQSKLFAEYRVYQYYIKSKVKNLDQVPSYLVTSTLDPKSYISYHGGSDSIELSLLRSWMCLGNTARGPICTISLGQELEEEMKK